MGVVRGGTLPVRSTQDIYVRASAGHASTHFGLPSHRKHLVALLVSGSNEIISHGQAFRHTLQPVHLYGSMTLAFTGGFTSMAALGQASAQGTGWGHCLQKS